MFLGAGTAACLIAVSDPLIAIVYGPGWEKAATIFRWLAVSLFAGIPMNASGWIYISLGKTRRMFVWSLIFVPIVGLGFLLAIPYGVVGIAASYAITMNLLLLPCFAFASQREPRELHRHHQGILPLAACGVVAAMAGVSVSDRGLPPLRAVAAGSVGFGRRLPAVGGLHDHEGRRLSRHFAAASSPCRAALRKR